MMHIFYSLFLIFNFFAVSLELFLNIEWIKVTYSLTHKVRENKVNKSFSFAFD